jgi:magnesium and cobalt transporter
MIMLLEKLTHLISRDPQTISQLIELLRNAEARNLLDLDTLSMLEGVIRFSHLQVRDIMIPRTQMVVIESNTKLDKLFSLVKQYGHSRYPIIGDERDEILGILHAKDLIHLKTNQNDFNLTEILRPASIIPESKHLNILLREFRINRNHMAIVVDEYGSVSGFVTIEDLLEQIVGDIEDEFDNDDEAFIKKHPDGRYIIKAQIPIEELNEYFEFNLNSQNYDTLGGMLIKSFGSVPNLDDIIKVGGLSFKVLNADNRRIKLVEYMIEGKE